DVDTAVGGDALVLNDVRAAIAGNDAVVDLDQRVVRDAGFVVDAATVVGKIARHGRVGQRGIVRPCQLVIVPVDQPAAEAGVIAPQGDVGQSQRSDIEHATTGTVSRIVEDGGVDRHELAEDVIDAAAVPRLVVEYGAVGNRDIGTREGGNAAA